jgi:hypothetical protein
MRQGQIERQGRMFLDADAISDFIFVPPFLFIMKSD